MNTECNREWTRKFCVASFTKVFWNKTYKTHCEQLLYDRELALMPATQPYVEQLMEKERINAEIIQTQLAIRRLYAHRAELVDRRLHARTGETATRATFVRACPDADCRGFLSSQWKCGLCLKWSCPECSEVKGEERDAPHECNPDNVASTALMRRDTKPCPTCGMGIFRISGCSQLWCTQCHTAFCWNTGHIETRHVHNPHYFEWMRMQQATEDGDGALQRDPGALQREAALPRALPRDPADIPCGRELDTMFTRRLMKKFGKLCIPEQKNKQLLRIVRQTIHLNRVEIPNYRTDVVADNRELRIKYLRKLITEDQFKTILQKHHKKHSKKHEIMEVLQMMVLTCTDILHRFRAELDAIVTKPLPDDPAAAEALVANARRIGPEICTRYEDEIHNLRQYANGCLKVVGTTYGCLPMMFDSALELVYVPRT